MTDAPISDDAPTDSTPLIRRSDLLALPGWLLKRAIYFAPTTWLLRYARLQGYVLSFTAHKRKRLQRRIGEVFAREKSELEVRAIVRRHIQFLEENRVLKVWPQRADFAGAVFEVEGREHVEAALAAGKGAFLGSMHFGNSRLVKHLARNLGYEAKVVGNLTPLDEELESAFRRVVYRGLLRLPDFDEREDNDLPTGINVRPILRSLAANELVLLAIDGNQAAQFVPVDVLGLQIPLANGIVRMASASGAPIIPSFVVDGAANESGLKLLFLAPIFVPPDVSQDGIVRVLREFGAQFEAVAKQYPHLCHWLLISNAKRKRAEREDLSTRYLRRHS